MRLQKITGRTASSPPASAASAALYQQLFHTTPRFLFCVVTHGGRLFEEEEEESVIRKLRKMKIGSQQSLVHTSILFHRCFLEFGCFWRKHSKHLTQFKKCFENQLKNEKSKRRVKVRQRGIVKKLPPAFIC